MKTVKRVFVYILGFFLLAIGINISKLASLGISPVSSMPYTVELVWGIELGKATIITYIGLILFQILLLGKEYKIRNLLQFISTYLLGTLITYTSSEYLLFWMPAPVTYIIKFIYLFISIIVIGFGIFLFLSAEIMPLPAEGLSQAIVKVSKEKINLGNAKIIVDTGMVFTSALVSLIFHGSLKSVREGTILTALLVGKVVGFLMKIYMERIRAWMGMDGDDTA
jgi:uncharacterized membrane protein YczE